MYMNDLPHGETVLESTQAAWRMALHSANALQLGVDMAWDFFVLPGLILLGIAVMRHPRFGHWFGWPAVVIGLSGIVLNSWTFPDPPDSSGLLDVGPVVGLWFTVMTIQMVRCYRKISVQA